MRAIASILPFDPHQRKQAARTVLIDAKLNSDSVMGSDGKLREVIEIADFAPRLSDRIRVYGKSTNRVHDRLYPI
ncbi:MAG: hypothetical protein AB1589_15215 [Cyanobacteriota bacterium]